jgi:hypothetical protein
MDETIKIIGLENLTDDEKKTAEKIIDKYYKKLQFQIKHVDLIEIHIKEYRTEGRSKQYSINLQVILHTRKFESDSIEWVLSKALKEAFEKILTEFEHEFH